MAGQNQRFHLKVEKAEGPEGTALLDYPVERVQAKATLSDGRTIDIPGRHAIVRTDIPQTLGVVSDSYKWITHKEMKIAVDKALFELGLDFKSKVKLVSGGERCYIDYILPNVAGDINPELGDLVQFRARAHNSVDGRVRLGMSVGGERLVCSNGMTAYESLFNVSKKHTATLDLQEIVQSLKDNVSRFTDYLVPFWRGLAEKSITDLKGIDVIDENSGKTLPKKYDEHIRHRWLHPVREEDSGRNLWSLYNAYTDASTHKLAERALERGQDAEAKIHGMFLELAKA